MAIEQRIGRIDRIGQQREVFVFNLVTRGTLEEQVLHSARREDLHVRAGGRRGRGDPGRPRGGARFRRPRARCLAGHDRGGPRRGVRRARPPAATRRRRQHEGAKALDEALFGEDFETA